MPNSHSALLNEQMIARLEQQQIRRAQLQNNHSALLNEQTILRAELRQLKKCQLQYFLLTITGTGVLLRAGDIFSPGKDTMPAPYVYLLPLIIILPCWWTFFDKATTITRLVGYMRLLEDELAKKKPRYTGYENALNRFRRVEDQGKKIPGNAQRNAAQGEEEAAPDPPDETIWKKISRILSKWWNVILGNLGRFFYGVWRVIKLFMLATRHRYWMINWYTFFILSLLCLLFPPLTSTTDQWSRAMEIGYGGAGIAVLISAVSASWIVARLTFGHFSYRKVGAFWHDHVRPFERP